MWADTTAQAQAQAYLEDTVMSQSGTKARQIKVLWLGQSISNEVIQRHGATNNNVDHLRSAPNQTVNPILVNLSRKQKHVITLTPMNKGAACNAYLALVIDNNKKARFADFVGQISIHKLRGLGCATEILAMRSCQYSLQAIKSINKHVLRSQQETPPCYTDMHCRQ